ncbi:MAG: P-loop ATPase, Sll1717 family [Jatrophihabitantaceae bacterium]
MAVSSSGVDQGPSGIIPFGHPDGAREDLSGPIVDFAEIGLAAREYDARRVSVVAGRMGAGKTLWLRDLSRHLAIREDIASDGPVTWTPSTSAIMRFSHMFPRNLHSEMWKLAWDRAILRSVASWVAHGHPPRYRPSASFLSETPETRRRLDEFIPHRSSSVYGELSFLINNRSSRSATIRFLEDPRWEELRDLLGAAALTRPPLYLLLDAIDENFDSAPAYWLSCQEGLYLSVMQWRRTRLYSRFKVIVGLRDLVLSSIASSEHSHRLLLNSGVHNLIWTESDLQRLVMLKVSHYNSDLIGDGIDATLKHWLGFSQLIEGPSIRVWDLIVKFTSWTPRDLINILNTIAAARAQPEWGEGSFLTALTFAARYSGMSKLATVRNEVASLAALANASYSGEGAHRSWIEDSYEAAVTDDLSSRMSSQIESVLRSSLATDGMSVTLNSLSSQSIRLFGIDISDVLWRQGLIGLVEIPTRDHRITARFHQASAWDSLSLPSGAVQYVYHPCVLSALRIPINLNRSVYPVYGDG